MIKEIKAHKEGISSMCLVKDPQCIATCGYDCMAIVWTPELKKIGSLIIGRDNGFCLKLPKEEWMNVQKEKTKNVVQKIEKLNNRNENTQKKGKGILNKYV